MTDGGAGGDTLSGKKNPGLTRRNLSTKGKPGISLLWLNKDGKNTRVKKEKLQEFLDLGWKEGALKTGPCEKRKRLKPWNTGITGYKNPKISAAVKGKSRPSYKRGKLKCPHCGKEGDATAIKRWHFDNCKIKIDKI